MITFDFQDDMKKIKAKNEILDELNLSIYNIMRSAEKSNNLKYGSIYVEMMVLVGKYRNIAHNLKFSVPCCYDRCSEINLSNFEGEFVKIKDREPDVDFVKMLEALRPNCLSRSNIELSGLQRMEIDEYCSDYKIVDIDVQRVKRSILTNPDRNAMNSYAYFMIKNALKVGDEVANSNENKFAIWTRYGVARDAYEMANKEKEND